MTLFGKAMKHWAFLFTIMLAACSPAGVAPIKTDVKSLLATPERFSGKQVELAGVLAFGFETMEFQDLISAHRTFISFGYVDFPVKEKDERGFNRLIDAYAKSQVRDEWALARAVSVRVVGLFEHAKAPKNGFGHLGRYRSQLTIERVLEATPCKEEPNQ